MATIQDLILRLEFSTESDPLDFASTGRGAIVVEDNQGNLPLPQGDKGEKGDKGDPGEKLSPDIVLDETTDSLALDKLRERSNVWRATGQEDDRRGYFGLNKPTKTGFFYTRGGWVTVRDVFGGSSEIVAGEFHLPTTFHNVEESPPAPDSGVTLYAEGNSLKMKKPDGTVKVLG